jgi:hypothetical protein
MAAFVMQLNALKPDSELQMQHPRIRYGCGSLSANSS